MLAKKRKISKKKASREREILDSETLREYQEPELFKVKFQKSETCRSFRRAWHIPVDGFDDYSAYSPFHTDLRKKDYDYAESEKFPKHRAEFIKSRKAWAEGKITAGALEMAEWSFARLTPSVKYDEDLDGLVRTYKKPLYWRDFIEECVLLRDVRPTFVTRPLPEPKVSWNNGLQRNELTIENIYSDTAVKDFTSREFTEKFNKLRKRLPGYGPRPRSKKSFGFGIKVLELEDSGLSDIQKADKIEGIEIKAIAFMKNPDVDLKNKNRVKTVRHRMKKRIGRFY